MDTLARQKHLEFLRWVKVVAFLSLLVFALVLLIALQDLLLSAVLALVICYLLDPLVNAVERTRTSRLVATTLTFLVVGLAFTVTIIAVAPLLVEQLHSFRDEFLNRYLAGTTELIAQAEKKVNQILGGGVNFKFGAQMGEYIQSLSHSIFEDLPAFISTSLTTLLLAPVFAFFMLKDGRRISNSFLSLVPNHLFEMILNLYHQINNQMAQFIRARLAEAAIVGLIVGFGLQLLNWVGITSLPYTPLFALFAGLLNLIPYVGPLVGAVPGLLVALITGHEGFPFGMILMVYLIAQVVDVVFIIPLVVAKIVDLHPVTVLVSIFVGAEILGVLGMLIAIPVASALKVTVTSVYRHLTDFRV